MPEDSMSELQPEAPSGAGNDSAPVDTAPAPVQDPVVEPVADAIEPAPEPKQGRSLWGLLGMIAIIVIVVLIILMLLRDCGGGPDGPGGGGGKTIEPVAGYDTVPGLVSVWIAEGGNIDEVLADAGVEANGTTDTGNGRYIVEVAPGTELASAEKLQGTDGVYDAGLVYEQDGEAAPAP